MVIEKIAKKQMGDIKPGQHYFEFSGKDLANLEASARFIGEPDLKKALIQILTEALNRDSAELMAA